MKPGPILASPRLRSGGDSVFKKLTRGIKKVVRKNKAGVGRLIKKVGPGLAMAAVGATAPALVVKAASIAKSAGKKVRGLETPKSLADVVKRAEVKVARTRTKMPGGAPMPTIGTPSIGMMASRAVGAHKTLYKSKKRRTRKAANGTPKKKRKITAAPSAKQIAARKAFAAAAAARRKKAA